MDRGAQLVLPAVVVPAAAARALRARRLRPARVPGERGAQLHRGWPPGLLDQQGRADLGHPDPVGSGFDRLRLGGRPRQLPERADLRTSRRGSDRDVLAVGQAPARQGHPALPLRLLARDAARCRIRAAAAAVRARVPAARRQGRSRSRSGTSSTRSTCSTSTAPIRSGSGARGRSRSVRTARHRSPESTSATSGSSGMISGTFSADDGDGLSLPQRHLARPADAGRRRRGCARAARRRRRRPARRASTSQVPSSAPGTSSAPSTERWRQRRPGSWRRTKRAPTISTGCSTTSSTASGPSPLRCRRTSRHGRGHPVGARASLTRSTVARRLRRSPPRRMGSRPLRRSSLASSCPRRSPSEVIDTHAHLDGCDEPAAFLVERARAVGVSRIVTIGTGIPSCHAALAIAAAEQGVFAALGIDPHHAGGPKRRGWTSSSSCSGTRGPWRSARRASTTSMICPRPVDSARSSIASSRSRQAASLPVVIHTRDADADTAAALAGFPGTVIFHCFAAPRFSPSPSSAATTSRSRAT